MPYYKVSVTKEVITELYIEADSEDEIRNLYDDQLVDLANEQCDRFDWEDCGWVSINTLEEIDEEEHTSYGGTNLKEFLNAN